MVVSILISLQQMAMENLSRQPQPIGKVFIQRDYSEGTQVRFQTKLPADLSDRVGTTYSLALFPLAVKVPWVNFMVR